ncbi:6-phosphogluconolactonase [Dermabacteraceae bacterium P7054]
MIKTLTNTTSSQVDKEMMSLRESGGALTLSRVLSLVIVTPASEMEEPIRAAVQASHEHPCRVLVLVLDAEANEDGLDAEIRVGHDAGAGEVVILHARGQVTTSIDTLITPLLLPDAPIVTWWPNNPPSAPAQDLVGRLSQRRITDSQSCPDPADVMKRLRRGYQEGDSDFSWTRLTNWRGLLASAFDVPPRQTPKLVEVTGNPCNPSVILMSSWLETRLGCEVRVIDASEEVNGLKAVRILRADGDIVLTRENDTQLAMQLPGSQKPQLVSLPRRSLFECLSEELRRLDPDVVYGEVIRHAFEEIADPAEYARNKPAPTVKVFADADELAAQSAKNIVDRLAAAISERGVGHLVLTGGSVGTKVALALPEAARAAGLPLEKLHLWWGDERFVKHSSEDRNDRAVSGLLDAEGLRPEHIHRMPASGSGMSPADAAAWYAQQLALWGGDAQFHTRGMPFFDVVLLGVGPDAHVASLFPKHEAQSECSHPVIPVHDSPKPPPTRVSLSYSVLNSSRSVMLLVAGAEKAEAVANSQCDPEPWLYPASSVRGVQETTWYLDEAAASQLP